MQRTYQEHNDLVAGGGSEGSQGRRHEQRDTVCEQRSGNPVKDYDEPLSETVKILFYWLMKRCHIPGTRAH